MLTFKGEMRSLCFICVMEWTLLMSVRHSKWTSEINTDATYIIVRIVCVIFYMQTRDNSFICVINLRIIYSYDLYQYSFDSLLY